MSKKVFLKRTYAEVLKGIDAVPTNEEGGVPETWEGTECTYGQGESVLKAKYTGFSYNRTKQPEDLQTSPRPNKTRKMSPKKKSRGQSPIIIWDSNSDLSLNNERDEREIIDITSSPLSEITCTKRVTVTSPNRISRRLSFHDDDDDLPSISPTSSPNVPPLSCVNVDSDDEIEFYQNDSMLPVIHSRDEGIKTIDVLNILLRPIEDRQIAKNIPFHIDKNVSFVYSVKHIGGHWKNALCDGMGVWKQNGKETRFADVTESGFPLSEEIVFVKERKITETSVKVVRHKYLNKSCAGLHRIVIHLEDARTNEALDMLYVQYYFDKFYPGEINIKPHGNSKKPLQFKKTSQTTKDRIKQLRSEKLKPKEINSTIFEESGGIKEVKSGAFLPRNRQQIYNQKTKVKCSDPIVECSDLAKEQEKSRNKFIRDVRSAPEFTLFLASDTQLNDIKKFCTANKNFSVLGVDTTFNIGQYYVTLFTYRNLMLQTNRGTEPVMIGPTLVHQRKTFESYFKLPSTLLQECPELRHLKCFGTDGDVNLSMAMESTFPDSKHLLCDIHMEDNIQRKLKQLGITGKAGKQILIDIFGDIVENKKFPGLVDCTSASEFDQKVNTFSSSWKECHEKGNEFWCYFIEFKSELIKNCMTSELQAMCGFGFPPKPYTQNANECMNFVIKNSLKSDNQSKVDPFEFAKKLEKIVQQQEREVKMAFVGLGEYKVKDEYRHLLIPEDQFWRKNASQREATLQRLQAQPLRPRQPEDESTEKTLNNLSMSPEDSQIISIPYRILLDIFDEADGIRQNERNIVSVPGSDQSIYFVKDRCSLDSPRKVTCNPNTGLTKCDNKCVRWKGYKFCGHTVAVADKERCLTKFVEKFKKQGTTANLSQMSCANLPKNRGKKPQKSTQVRKGRCNIPPSVVTEYQEDPEQHQPCHLTFMAGLIKKCYGCQQNFSDKQRHPPHDLILKRYDHRVYNSPKSKTMRKTKTLQNTYFHLNVDCVRKRHPQFEFSTDVILHEEIKHQLSSQHVQLLESLGLDIDIEEV